MNNAIQAFVGETLCKTHEHNSELYRQTERDLLDMREEVRQGIVACVDNLAGVPLGKLIRRLARYQLLRYATSSESYMKEQSERVEQHLRNTIDVCNSILKAMGVDVFSDREFDITSAD